MSELSLDVPFLGWSIPQLAILTIELRIKTKIGLSFLLLISITEVRYE